MQVRAGKFTAGFRDDDYGALLCRCDEVMDLEVGVIQDCLGRSNLLVWLLKKWKAFPG